MTCQAHVKDTIFSIAHIAPYPGDMAMAAAVPEEFRRFCAGEVAPLNALGDREGSGCHHVQAQAPAGFRQAYTGCVGMGWQGLVDGAEFGGQDLPRVVGAAAGEILNAADISFALCPMLTEPQAGRDLALVRRRADGQQDGTYGITGTNICIAYGQHDLAGNISHLVLPHMLDAPKGNKGISLFLVPKFPGHADGEPGPRHAVRGQTPEHKPGVRATPACLMQIKGTTGFLKGREIAGLNHRLAMMNASRFAVDVHGVAVGHRVDRQALTSAKTAIAMARFYPHRRLSQAGPQRTHVVNGAASLPDAEF